MIDFGRGAGKGPSQSGAPDANVIIMEAKVINMPVNKSVFS
jgi:hypothetical protein